MPEHILHELQYPDLVENAGDVRQLIFYPTIDTPGRCMTFSNIDTPTFADFFDNTCNAPEGIGPLLSKSGVTLEYKSIWSQKITQFKFPHPDAFDARLQAIGVAQPDFEPPHFEAFNEGRYHFDTLASYLGRGVMPLAVHGYVTVHDYEVHAPSLSVMAPELFTALCEQSQTVQPSEQSEWMKQFDTLTQLGAFGGLLASTSEANYRERMTSWLEEHTQFSTVDAIRLAYHSENYRREVVTPVVKHLSQ